MRTFKTLAVCGLMAGLASTFFGQAQIQPPGPSVADIKATSEAIETLQAQQKTIADNQAGIDAKLASIVENVRLARLFEARAK